MPFHCYDPVLASHLPPLPPPHSPSYYPSVPSHTVIRFAMSAIPNIPEDVVRVHSSNADHALQHLMNAKAAASHVERAEVDGETPTEPHTNGFKDIPFLLHDTPIENQRPIRVIVIGAGYSGVYCGIRIPERLRNCELVIYEKNPGIGGTW